MKYDDLRFKLRIIAHNDNGEKINIELIQMSRWNALQTLLSVGVKLGHTTLYSFKKERGYPMRKEVDGRMVDMTTSEIENTLHIRLAEFIHEPIIYVHRCQ